MTWVGQTRQTPGQLRFTGTLGSTGLHAHAAIQLLHIRTGHVVLRDAAGREQAVTDAAAIPTGAAHEIVAVPGTTGTITYLDPDSSQGAAYAAALSDDPASWTSVPPPQPSAVELNPALRRALQLAPQHLHGPLLLTELAQLAGISATRLGHLFTDELGLTYPTWRRWARLQHALAEVTAGASLTTAAHAAGFADSAHLTRSCRAMFGISPSQALAATR
ncbi:AraC family transcriptional regulator [Kribbella sp. NBC_01245]|uniref:AraC family transcriptional regulator n=1 Tax=Kribbella sp. NBC_01245 TaxID=2903578 RepID=UPI002E2962D9|nr:AraC family transcriptional regulator [Kribbella sp. NBC_01245]